MEREGVAALAMELMDKYHLREHGWRFGFDRAKTRCGCTDYDTKLITLSTYYLSDTSTSADEIKNTILHEIAHVIAGFEAGHNEYWRQIALTIGCDGTRCNAGWKGAPCKYDVTCACGCVHVQRHVIQQRLRRKRCRWCNTLIITELRASATTANEYSS